MNAPLIFNGGRSFRGAYDPDQFIDFDKVLVPGTDAISLVFDDAHILIQSSPNFLVSIDVYEFHIRKDDTAVYFEIPEPCICFEIFQSENMKLYHEDILIHEYTEPSCTLVTRSSGRYAFRFASGTHTAILFNINPEWIRQKSQVSVTLKSVIDTLVINETLELKECPYKNDIKHAVRAALYKKIEDITKFGINFNTLLHQILKSYQSCIDNGYELNKDLTQKNSDKLTAFIMENFTKEIVDNLDEVASFMCMSRKSLLRLAKATFEMGLKAYVISLRMNFAIKCLIQYKKSVAEAAEMTGYKDAFYFSRAFKKYWGVPPVEILDFGFSMESNDFL